MPSKTEQELAVLAAAYREYLPEGFEEEVAVIETELAGGRDILAIRERGSRGRKGSVARIRSAVLEELSLFLCSKDPRYKDLRKTGNTLSKDAANFIAGVVAGALSLSAGVATGCVAFLSLAALRVGIGTFCRLNPPPSKEKKKDSKKKPDKKKDDKKKSGKKKSDSGKKPRKKKS